MAERRMFAKSIIDSDAFLDMPLSAQALYFHLSMRGDDDGFINNPKKIQRCIGAADDDLKLLIVKRFIIPFESGIVVIKHWKIHNYIQKDRYKETAYIEEKQQLLLKENNTYTKMDTPCIHDVSKVETQVRLGKVRLGKEKDIVEQATTKYPYKEVVAYLNSSAGTGYKDTSKDTRRHIKARFDEGFTLEDFETVIDKKVSEWGREPKGGEQDMRKYIRPSTLFGTKFESYLNQPGKEKPNECATREVETDANSISHKLSGIEFTGF